MTAPETTGTSGPHPSAPRIAYRGSAATPRRPTSEPNELARHVKAWRLRLKPEDAFPGLDYHRTRRRRQASKELVATLTGCSVGWYSALERGLPQNYSDDFLNRVAYTLRLSPAEKSLLFFLATGHALAAAADESTMRSTPTIRRILEAQPWPAYVSDEAWDLVAYNGEMRKWFPWVAGHENNIMRWVFTFPEARTQLHRWDTDWAPQMFAQMQFAQARAPDNKRLAAVIDEILELNPDARRFKEQPLTYPHPDGDCRSLHLPLHRKVQPIELVAFAPMRAPGSRVMMLIPIESED
ncbi:helix-turn-helix transcriptional regulator [Actinoplanes sp. NPDC049681]|uniref:helix-turn-helix transcriptional regulator n=1 Tax=Actinoplanes sp. NPDC049681 TaxID=3363905 RepID=UPI0037B973AC